jgi:hypothetical protein
MTISLPLDRSLCPRHEATRGRLREIDAILTAIDQGELLAELPAGPGSRARHQAAVSLLAVMQRELRSLILDLDGEAGVDI